MTKRHTSLSFALIQQNSLCNTQTTAFRILPISPTNTCRRLSASLTDKMVTSTYSTQVSSLRLLAVVSPPCTNPQGCFNRQTLVIEVLGISTEPCTKSTLAEKMLPPKPPSKAREKYGCGPADTASARRH